MGGGVGMALTLHVEEGALVFRSAGYFVDVLGRRLWLPAELNPGVITATHAELGDGRFSFTLDAAETRVAFKIGSRGDIDFFGAEFATLAFRAGNHVIESLAFGGRQRMTPNFSGS